MTLHQFKHLSLKEQASILETRAVYLASMQDEGDTYNLFQIDGFYLEISCTGYELQVSSLNYFDEMSLLAPYLKLINIEDVYHLLGYRRFH